MSCLKQKVVPQLMPARLQGESQGGSQVCCSISDPGAAWSEGFGERDAGMLSTKHQLLCNRHSYRSSGAPSFMWLTACKQSTICW